MTEDPVLQRPAQAVGLSDDVLEELNRLWTIVRAFSTTAHDVNNALQVIAGSAELLEARDLDPAMRRRVEAVRVESGKAAQTIERLLSYARVARQPSRRLDLWQTVETAVAMRLASLGRLRITLTMDRGAQAPVWVDGEAGRLLQAVLDLLLVAEDRVAGLPQARIVVGVTADRDAGLLTIETSAGDGPRGGERSDEFDRGEEALTRHAQGWAAAHIAAAHGGDVRMTGTGLIMRWPAERQRSG